MKNKNIIKNFNLSYSAWNVFKTSEVQGYFQYIKKEKPTNQTVEAYSVAGNVVHHSSEDYINTGKNNFEERWENSRVNFMRGINGVKLSKHNYNSMYNKSVEHIDKYDGLRLIAEKDFKFEFHGMTIKGQIDLVVDEPRQIILIDWKTNSKNSYEMHKDQRLFYSWAIWKTTGKLVKTSWIYLKDNKNHDDSFTIEDLQKFEQKIIKFIDDIQEKGEDISKYSLGEWKNPFNAYLNLCSDEFNKRLKNKNQKVTLKIKGHYVFIETLDPVLLQGIDHATKFNLKDKKYMQEHTKKNRKGVIDIEDIGVYHLFNKKFKCFPIGILDKVKEIIKEYQEYQEYYKKNIELEIIDYRDVNVMDKKNVNNFKKSDNIKLRKYQEEAKNIFIKKKQGIIQMATGAGKTYTASEIIRELNAQTLWIIDRKELLEQTKKALENFLGIEVGVIMGNKCEIDKSITIATIQSLHKKMNDLKEFLYLFNFVIVDEFHKAAAESYQKVFAKLPNAKYKLGLTATPYRDDGKEPILFSILGDIIYKINSKELIEQGYLINPDVYFIKIPDNCDYYDNYQEEYKETIVKGTIRNNNILKICKENINNKILILTKSVEHGKFLYNNLNSLNKVFHIHGSMTKSTRTRYYNDFVKSKFGIMIMTISIGAEGLDIPDLNIIINASGNKGDVKSIQVLGRSLRKFEGKTKAIYYDFVDSGKWTYKHSLKRMKIYKSEGYKINVIPENK